MSNKIKYSYNNTLISLRSYIADTLGSSIDGIQYYYMHKCHTCYKCGIKGHIAADCDSICPYCNNKHINGVCIWHLNDFAEKLLKKLEEPMGKDKEAKMRLYAETLKEKYMKQEGTINLAKMTTKKHQPAFSVTKTSNIEIKPSFYTTTLTIPATRACGNKNPCFIINNPHNLKDAAQTKQHNQQLQDIKTKLANLNIQKNNYKLEMNKFEKFKNEVTGKYGDYLYKPICNLFGKKQMIEDAKKYGIQLPYFGKEKYLTELSNTQNIYLKEENKYKEIKPKYDDVCTYIKKLDAELFTLQLTKPKPIIMQWKKDKQIKLGNMGIVEGNHKKFMYKNDRQQVFTEIRRMLVKAMNKTHQNPLLESFYEYTNGKKYISDTIKMLEKKMDSLSNQIKKKNEIIAHKDKQIKHKHEIVNKIIGNAQTKAEKIRNVAIQNKEKAQQYMRQTKKQYEKQKYLADKYNTLAQAVNDDVRNVITNIKNAKNKLRKQHGKLTPSMYDEVYTKGNKELHDKMAENGIVTQWCSNDVCGFCYKPFDECHCED